MKVTFDIDPDRLSGLEDSSLAAMWHIAQANPAPYGDPDAAELVAALTREIVRRWLKNTPAEMGHHQDRDRYWKWLSAFAKYTPPPGSTVPGSQETADFHYGVWGPRDPEETRTKLVSLTEEMQTALAARRAVRSPDDVEEGVFAEEREELAKAAEEAVARLDGQGNADK